MRSNSYARAYVHKSFVTLTYSIPPTHDSMLSHAFMNAYMLSQLHYHDASIIRCFWEAGAIDRCAWAS